MSHIGNQQTLGSASQVLKGAADLIRTERYPHRSLGRGLQVAIAHEGVTRAYC